MGVISLSYGVSWVAPPLIQIVSCVSGRVGLRIQHTFLSCMPSWTDHWTPPSELYLLYLLINVGILQCVGVYAFIPMVFVTCLLMGCC